MEIGRNIQWDNESYYVAFRFAGEKLMRKWYCKTRIGALRKHTELKNKADYLPIQEDVTI